MRSSWPFSHEHHRLVLNGSPLRCCVCSIQEKMGIFLSSAQLAGLLAGPHAPFHEETTTSAHEIPLRLKEPSSLFLAGTAEGADTGTAAVTRTGAGPASQAEGGRVLRRSHRARAVLSPHDSFLGHFVERVGSLAEVSAALVASLAGAAPPSPVQTSLGGTGGTTAAAEGEASLGGDASASPGQPKWLVDGGTASASGGHALQGGDREGAGPLLEDLGVQLGGKEGLASVMLFATDARGERPVVRPR